jgi:hypothetical protein
LIRRILTTLHLTQKTRALLGARFLFTPFATQTGGRTGKTAESASILDKRNQVNKTTSLTQHALQSQLDRFCACLRSHPTSTL